MNNEKEREAQVIAEEGITIQVHKHAMMRGVG